MGLKQLQEELHKAVPHLKLIVPAAVAVVWLIGKVTGRGRQHDQQLQPSLDEEEVIPLISA